MTFIDNYFDSAMGAITGEAVVLWMFLVAITGIITYMFYRCGKMKGSTAIIFPILVFFLSFTLTITIIERVPTITARYNLELFWTIKHILAGRKELIWEIFWNVVLFVPTGLMVSALIPRRVWLSMPICVAGSAAIEVTQLLMHRGLFEFDDIVHNGLGALIGFFLFFLLMKTGRRERKKEPSSA